MSGAREGSDGDPSASPSSTDSLVWKTERNEQRTKTMSKLDSLKKHSDPEISQSAHTVASSAAAMGGEDLERAVEVIEVLRDMLEQQLEEGEKLDLHDAEGDEGGDYQDQEGAGQEEDGSDEE